MGNLFKTKGTAVNDPTAVEAFNLAKPFYQQGLGGISGLADRVGNDPAYGGQRVADLNPFQTTAANTLGTFANNTAGYAQNFMNQGLGNLGSSGNVGGNYQDIYNRSSMDPTQSILASANQYANNPYVDGLIDSSTRDVARQFSEQTMPGLNRAFAGSGNTNSTRAGVEAGIAQRGAGDRMADISSGIRSQFFGQGLSMGQNQYNQNLQNMMGANQGLMSAGQFGAGLLNNGQQYAQNNFGMGQLAGGMYQGQNQAQLDASKSYWNESLQNPLSVYSALLGGAAQTKTTGAAGTVTQPSIMSQAGSFIGALGKVL